jgi:hypothetical protein
VDSILLCDMLVLKQQQRTTCDLRAAVARAAGGNELPDRFTAPATTNAHAATPAGRLNVGAHAVRNFRAGMQWQSPSRVTAWQ